MYPGIPDFIVEQLRSFVPIDPAQIRNGAVFAFLYPTRAMDEDENEPDDPYWGFVVVTHTLTTGNEPSKVYMRKLPAPARGGMCWKIQEMNSPRPYDPQFFTLRYNWDRWRRDNVRGQIGLVDDFMRARGYRSLVPEDITPGREVLEVEIDSVANFYKPQEIIPNKDGVTLWQIGDDPVVESGLGGSDMIRVVHFYDDGSFDSTAIYHEDLMRRGYMGLAGPEENTVRYYTKM